ncbi:MAG: vWA domain-containing protein [Planctomycetota bacterium]
MRNRIAFCGVVFCASYVWVASAQDTGRQRYHYPLDLPVGGGVADADDEDVSETITFYGAEYEGDAFFWCLDKSCSMGWAADIETLKQETALGIQQLSRQTQFALVAFSSNYIVWPPDEQPTDATPANKSAAIGWVQSLAASGETCLGPAIIKTIEIANISAKPRRQILLLGDGVPYCGGTPTSSVPEDIAAANYQQISINTLYISATPDGIPLFQQIAAQNSGSFTIVE